MDFGDWTPAGHVEPDGPGIELVDGPLRLRKFSVEEFDNNVYVLSCARTGASLLVDVAARPERLREATDDVDVLAAVQTHGHWDHVRAWATLVDDHGWQVWGHPGDATDELYPRAPARMLDDGEVLEVGDLGVEVLHVPGHTPGSLLFLVEGQDVQHPYLVSGDSLFPGGVGNTFGSAEAFDQLFTGIVTHVFDRLPDETLVLPGHGDNTTLGAERPHLTEWRERGW